MAIVSTSSAQGLSSGVFAQIQQQQAQRNADQAERQARSLQAQAQGAQTVAARAQESARSLKVEAGQAKDDASSARQGLAALKSLGEVQTQLGGLRDQIKEVLSLETDSAPVSTASSTLTGTAIPTSLTPVVNIFGQPTGTLVNVTA